MCRSLQICVLGHLKGHCLTLKCQSMLGNGLMSDPSKLVAKILVVTDKLKDSMVKLIYVSEISTQLLQKGSRT